MSDETTVRVGSVMVDCNDPELLARFWGTLLGLTERHRDSEYIWLSRMGEGGPSLAFQKVPEERSGKNRLHLDLGASDPEALIARAESLGAARLEEHEAAGYHWTVLADPEGNVFCVGKG